MHLKRVFIICLLSGYSVVFTPARATGSIDESNTVHLIHRISVVFSRVAPWPAYFTNYSKTNWDQLVLLAKDVQSAKPAIVRDAFRTVQFELGSTTNEPERTVANEQSDTDGKLLLLMRVIFRLPESILEKDSVRFDSYITMNKNYNEDGTRCNVSWPVDWSDDKPSLISGFAGISGMNVHRYDAVAEYCYFKERYKLRDLSSYKF